MQMGDERLLAALSVFHPELYGLGTSRDLSHVTEVYKSDPSDPKDEDYITQTMSKHEQVEMLGCIGSLVILLQLEKWIVLTPLESI